MNPPELLNDLHWLGHDSFRLDRPVVIYIDPWNLAPDSPPADLILVSHDHYDHCSPDDVQRVRRADTVVAANPAAAAKLAGPVQILRPGDEAELRGVTVRTLPAYNLNKRFHPRAAEGLGFLLTLGDETLYFAGDTDAIPEMEGLRPDLALLPVSGTYVMTAEEAVEAARAMQPRWVVPMHYGAGVVGEPADAERFLSQSPAPVTILQVERS